MKLTNKKISILFFSIWLAFLIFTVLDNKFIFFPKGFDLIQTLRLSVFARGMFIDISILSILSSFWVLKYTDSKYKYIFAVGIIFLGSLALLPYLSIYFWNKDKE